MAFEDFCRYFTSLDICHVINRSFFSFKKTWKEGNVVGEWRRPDRCGGCGNYSSFLNNPQVCRQCSNTPSTQWQCYTNLLSKVRRISSPQINQQSTRMLFYVICSSICCIRYAMQCLCMQVVLISA